LLGPQEVESVTGAFHRSLFEDALSANPGSLI
jgi:hypothetical protein